MPEREETGLSPSRSRTDDLPGQDLPGQDSTGSRRPHIPPLLESLVSDHLDPGYQAAADRRQATARDAAAGAGDGSGPLAGNPRAGRSWTRSTVRSRSLVQVGAGLLVIGAVLGIAGASTEHQSAGTDQARLSLLHDIDNAQADQQRLAATQSALAAQLRSAQASLGAGGPLQTVQQLEAQGGQTAVAGPGLTVVIDGSTASSGAGVILDRDVQLLVNGLWTAGAEAISVGGVRLRTTSAIRQAGAAILVDNRPVFWPISIAAVGNPSTLHVHFLDTVGFGRFQTFVSLYGIRFDVSAATALTLPPAGPPDLRYASALPTPASTTPEKTTAATTRSH